MKNRRELYGVAFPGLFLGLPGAAVFLLKSEGGTKQERSGRQLPTTWQDSIIGGNDETSPSPGPGFAASREMCQGGGVANVARWE